MGACCDALDGSLARYCSVNSELGKYMDSVADRLSELIFITCAVAGGLVSPMAFVVAAGSFPLMAARDHDHIKEADSNAAAFGRPERLTLLIAGLLSPEPLANILFLLAGTCCLISSLQVIIYGRLASKAEARQKAAL